MTADTTTDGSFPFQHTHIPLTRRNTKIAVTNSGFGVKSYPLATHCAICDPPDSEVDALGSEWKVPIQRGDKRGQCLAKECEAEKCRPHQLREQPLRAQEEDEIPLEPVIDRERCDE